MNNDELRDRLYELLNKYSVADINREFQFCLDYPEPQIIEVVCLSRDFNNWDLWKVHRYNRLTSEAHDTQIPHTQIQGWIDSLLGQDYETYLNSCLDPNREAALYLCKTAVRASYEAPEPITP